LLGLNWVVQKMICLALHLDYYFEIHLDLHLVKS